MAEKKSIPDWHSEESARIEALRWNEATDDFDALYSHVRKKIAEELHEQGEDLSKIVTDDELRREVRTAAESYDDKRRELIGLEIHVKLWIRAFVAAKMEWQKGGRV
jgi:hypothetical protein